MLIGPINSGAAVGNAGSATATGVTSVVVRGIVHQMQIKYNDSPPGATTDVIVRTKGTNAPSITLYSKADSATDVTVFPRFDSVKASDGSALSKNEEMAVIEDYVEVVIAQANAGDNIDVWLYVCGGG